MIINQADVIHVLKLYPQETVHKPKWHDDHGWLCMDGLLLIHVDKIGDDIFNFMLDKQPHITNQAFWKLRDVSDDQRLIYLQWFYNQNIEVE